MDNVFLAAFLGCAFALVIWTVVIRAMMLATFRRISGAMPESVQRAADMQGQFIARAMSGDARPIVAPPPAVPPIRPECVPCQFKQIGDEAPGHNAAWMVECVCGWASFASTSDDAVERFRKHKPLLVGPRGAPPEVGHGG